MYYCCEKCGKLYVDYAPEKCSEPLEEGGFCDGKVEKGLISPTYAQKQEIARIRRQQDNDKVKRAYSLKPKGGKK